MADAAKDIVESLRLAQEQIAGRRDPVNAFNRIEVAIALIEQQAALIERLTPKPMTLERAVEVFNDRGWRGSKDYVVIETTRFVQSERGSKVYIESEAIYIAQGIEREQEAARA